jgi:hypothetical protein
VMVMRISLGRVDELQGGDGSENYPSMREKSATASVATRI